MPGVNMTLLQRTIVDHEVDHFAFETEVIDQRGQLCRRAESGDALTVSFQLAQKVEQFVADAGDMCGECVEGFRPVETRCFFLRHHGSHRSAGDLRGPPFSCTTPRSGPAVAVHPHCASMSSSPQRAKNRD